MFIDTAHTPAATIAPDTISRGVATINKVGFCVIVPNGAGHDVKSAENMIEPKLSLAEFLESDGATLKLDEISQLIVEASPAHGELVDLGQGVYSYRPEKGYFGLDKATLKVTFKNRLIELVFSIQSIGGVAVGDTAYDSFCPKGDSWRISFWPKAEAVVTN